MDDFYKNAQIYNTAEKLQHYWNTFRPGQVREDGYINKWLKQSTFLDTVSVQNRACVTLWDVVANRFVNASDKTYVLGDNPARFTDNDGVDFSVARFPAGYIDALMLMQLKAHEYYAVHPELIPNDLVINMDGRYNTDRGQIHIVQRACVVEVDENRKRLLFLSHIHDITHLKKDPSDALVLNSSLETILYKYNFSKRNLVTAKQVSSREGKVLDLLGHGHNTKDIADKLNISPHTVDTHRRNLLSKTCCVDSIALVTYSKMVGLI